MTAALLHRSRDAKLVLALVIVALLAVVLVLALTGHHVPDALNSGLVGAVGSLAGVSVPVGATAALTSAETDLGRAVPTGDLTTLRHDVDQALNLAGNAMSDVDRQRVYERIAGIERELGISLPVAGGAPAGPLPDAEPAS